ncbi:MAG TPA: sugar-binding protein, partial [Pirellulales bacterium]|nr:sugar-binding protein [Pirellulales bacterium]
GVESARAVDPSLRSVLAGGLWPRGFRLDVLNAGAGNYVDVLPIHYGNGSGIHEAREDLDSFGHQQTSVWENESSAFVIQWDCPGLDVVSETAKSKWVMTHWTDELAAGCEKLIYFGGEGDAIGNGDYLRSDLTPLPVAATLGVFAAKTFHAAPVGVFSFPDTVARFHLFNRDGQALLVVERNSSEKGETSLNVGTPTVRITDCQGNEIELATSHGVAHLQSSDLPYFIEGADLEVLKTNLVPSIVAPSNGGGIDLSGAAPQVTLLKGKPGSIQVRLQNLYDRQLAGTLRSDMPATWTQQSRIAFQLDPGERKTLTIPITVPESTPIQNFAHSIAATFDGMEKLPDVTKPFVVSVISPENVGNLLKNGDFEEIDSDGKSPKHWQGTGAELISSEGLGLGLGKRVLRFPSSEQWANFGQPVELRGGTTYLYTAWIWNRGKEGGSNIMQTMKDGTSRPLYDNQVINIGNTTTAWQVFTCRYQAPKDLATAAFVPVARGPGNALYDNLRVTVFEGTDFAAEAIKVRQPPTIDGSLDEWDGKSAIPLLGRNQLRTLDKNYNWTPQNLSGVAYLRWDAKNLYVAIDVLDDIHYPAGDGDSVVDGDSVIVAFDPTNRSPDAASKSFAYYISSQKPAGGSGRHTLWRPSVHSGGRPSGHLARDSSVYELIVKPGLGRCVYEMRIPWSELGISPAFGEKFGFSVQLNDNDGQGPAAQMNWGGGISPTWHPASFGIVTLVE